MIRGRAVRHVPEGSMDEDAEPVVSYTRLPPDEDTEAGDGRVEPRLSVIPMKRKARFDEVAAPTRSERAERGQIRFEAEPVEALPPSRDERPRGRRRFPVVATVGVAALLIGFGVLAATFSKVMHGDANVSQAPAVESSDVALEPPPPALEDTAGPGVRAIPGTATDQATVSNGAATNTTTVAKGTDTTAVAPKPRLRPSTTDTTVATLPSPAETLRAPTKAPGATPPPANAAPASDDVNDPMAGIDRILADRQATADAAAAAGANDAPVAIAPAAVAPMPQAQPLPGTTIGMLGGAESVLRSDASAPLAPRPANRGVVLFPDDQSLPVPPADIPDPEGAPGQ